MKKLMSFLFACILSIASSVFAGDILAEIRQGNVKGVKALLKTQSGLLTHPDQKNLILHAAVLTGNDKMVKAVLASNMDINILDLEHKTALDRSLESGFNKISYLLLKKGAKVTTQDNVNKAQALATQRYKKIMRIFWIIAPIVILTMPVWMIPFLMVTLPMSPLHSCTAMVMGTLFLSMWSLPVYASTWNCKHFAILL